MMACIIPLLPEMIASGTTTVFTTLEAFITPVDLLL